MAAGGTRRALVFALLVVFGALAGVALGAAVLGATLGLGVLSYLLPAVVAICGLAALWYAHELLGGHFQALERLRGAVVTLAGNPSARLPVMAEEEGDLETRRLHGALEQLVARQAGESQAPDDRLQAVLASIEEAMVVVTDDGQVSLVNHAAKALLGAGRVAVGTSVYAALSRTTVRDALKRAHAAGRPIDAMIGTLEDYQLSAKVAALGEHGGAVLTFPAGEVAFRAELDCDLALHDRPPPAGAVSEATPLEDLPALVLDTETTGLDVAADRIVSVGAVRLHGGRIYRSTSFDRLVDPGMPIPPRSTAVHGITDAMVAGAAGFPAVFRELEPLLSGTVMVGHHIAFDLAMLSRECALAGMDWAEPASLDTLLLAAALEPGREKLSLDALAESLGVSVHGRHTALGDSLVTAEVYGCLLHRLHDRGVTTLGEAAAFSRRARAILRQQEEAGW